MEFVLPHSKAKITIFDYIPQKVVEASQEQLFAGFKMKTNQQVTDDDILEHMGADFLMKMQHADPEENKEMMDKARQKITKDRVNTEITIKDLNLSNLVKICGMIISIEKVGKTVEFKSKDAKEDFVMELKSSDYEIILSKITQIEEEDEKTKKESCAR